MMFMRPPTPASPSPHLGPAKRPVVLVPACNKALGEHPFHTVGRKYIDAVRLAGALPLVVPSAEPWELDELLDLADGVMLTGSASNVHPSHFDEDVHDPSLAAGPGARRLDAAADPQGAGARHAAAGHLPRHAGSQRGPGRHAAPGGARGRDPMPTTAPRPTSPRPCSTATRMPCRCSRAAGSHRRVLGPAAFEVNSVHGQGLNRLAPGLRVEATAPDGLVEAFSVEGATGFNLCLQWHPEWRAADNPVSRRLFEAFGQALRNYRDRVRGPLPA